jgi:hypothetical protein
VFKDNYKHLTISSVWLIEKSKKNDGFQVWHRDFWMGHEVMLELLQILYVGSTIDVTRSNFMLQKMSLIASNYTLDHVSKVHSIPQLTKSLSKYYGSQLNYSYGKANYAKGSEIGEPLVRRK